MCVCVQAVERQGQGEIFYGAGHIFHIKNVTVFINFHIGNDMKPSSVLMSSQENRNGSLTRARKRERGAYTRKKRLVPLAPADLSFVHANTNCVESTRWSGQASCR